MKFLVLLASVTLSSHTLGIEKPRTLCPKTHPQPSGHKPCVKAASSAK